MTDIDILNTSWKTEVTPEQSAEIQRLLFKHGKRWINGSTEIQTSGNLIDDQLAYRKNHLSCCIIPSSYEEKIKKINADDIIASLRKLEEGDKPVSEKTNEDISKIYNDFLGRMILEVCKIKKHDFGNSEGDKTVSEETNEDGWIRLSKQFPPLEEIVELEINKDDKISKIKGYFRLFVSVSGFESYIFVDQKHYEFSGTVVQWRPLKEKRPDFGKLRDGDKIFITYDERDEIYGVTFKYMTDGYLRSKYHPNHDYIDFCKDRIKKITRINLETREVEEI